MKSFIYFIISVGVLSLEFATSNSAQSLADTNLGEDVHLRAKRDLSESSYFYYQQPHYPRDCTEVYEQCNQDMIESGVFTIQPDGAPEPFEVYCNNSIDGGKWTVFQRRMSGAVDFYRTWDEYKDGFGFLRGEFWLGNDKIAYITNQGDYELRIDFLNRNGNPCFAKYNLFRISDEWSKYRLVDLGDFLPESTSGEALHHHRNMSFSTYDRDNDLKTHHCAVVYHGAWWYAQQYCHNSNLNGDYFGCDNCYQSVRWHRLPESEFNIKFTEMKLRSL